jgi:hypothetical protein
MQDPKSVGVGVEVGGKVRPRNGDVNGGWEGEQEGEKA